MFVPSLITLCTETLAKCIEDDHDLLDKIPVVVLSSVVFEKLGYIPLEVYRQKHKDHLGTQFINTKISERENRYRFSFPPNNKKKLICTTTFA